MNKYLSCCCKPINCTVLTPAEECGVHIAMSSDTCVTRICGQVTYTVVVTNNSSLEMTDCCLKVPLDGVLCLMPNSVTVNNEAVTVDSLDLIPLGTIAANGGQAVVRYTVTVVEYKRCIITRAAVRFFTCCCFNKACYKVYSEPICVQVCNCCACCNSTPTN